MNDKHKRLIWHEWLWYLNSESLSAHCYLKFISG